MFVFLIKQKGFDNVTSDYLSPIEGRPPSELDMEALPPSELDMDGRPPSE